MGRTAEETLSEGCKKWSHSRPALRYLPAAPRPGRLALRLLLCRQLRVIQKHWSRPPLAAYCRHCQGSDAADGAVRRRAAKRNQLKCRVATVTEMQERAASTHCCDDEGMEGDRSDDRHKSARGGARAAVIERGGDVSGREKPTQHRLRKAAAILTSASSRARLSTGSPSRANDRRRHARPAVSTHDRTQCISILIPPRRSTVELVLQPEPSLKASATAASSHQQVLLISLSRNTMRFDQDQESKCALSGSTDEPPAVRRVRVGITQRTP